MRRGGLFAALLTLLFICSVEAPRAEPQSMVAAAHPLAVDAGLEALRKGGSAVDAAVAAQMVLGVVEPQASGLGGGGFLLYYDANSRAITVYDGRETAPAGATPGMFLGGNAKPLPFREAVVSGISVGVPGALALLELVHKEHGKRPWAELFQPAIQRPQHPPSTSPNDASQPQDLAFMPSDACPTHVPPCSHPSTILYHVSLVASINQ